MEPLYIRAKKGWKSNGLGQSPVYYTVPPTAAEALLEPNQARVLSAQRRAGDRDMGPALGPKTGLVPGNSLVVPAQQPSSSGAECSRAVAPFALVQLVTFSDSPGLGASGPSRYGGRWCRHRFGPG